MRLGIAELITHHENIEEFLHIKLNPLLIVVLDTK